MSEVQLQATEQPWMNEGACAEVDPELFFPETAFEAKAAKRICRGCDVARQCLIHALNRPQEVGIWGGTSDRQRQKLRANKTAKAA